MCENSILVHIFDQELKKKKKEEKEKVEKGQWMLFIHNLQTELSDPLSASNMGKGWENQIQLSNLEKVDLKEGPLSYIIIYRLRSLLLYA